MSEPREQDANPFVQCRRLKAFRGLMEAVAIDPSILECQKAVSTLFWTCIEQLLCVKATLCADTIETLCLRARARKWKPGFRVCLRVFTLRPHSSRCVLHLSPRDILENVSSAGPPERQRRAQTDVSAYLTASPQTRVVATVRTVIARS